MNDLNSKFNFFRIPFILVIFGISVFISSCSDNAVETAFQTDDDYIKYVALNGSYSNDPDDDDNLFYTDVMDFETGGAVYNDENNISTPIDSIIKWGRRITGRNVNVNISNHGDTIKDVNVEVNISGNFIVIGYINGELDSTLKPFTQQQNRKLIFKRVNRQENPRLNWRVFKYSAIDGETKTPEIGKDNIVMNRIEYYRNNELILTLDGPDFTSNIFTARHFGNNSLIDISRGDQIRIKVYLTSNQNEQDIVAYHWARNSHGHHRVPFEMTSEIQNGNNFDRIFEKTFEIYNNHGHGMHNGYISSLTRSSLFDNTTSLFSSTYMGLPYRVRH